MGEGQSDKERDRAIKRQRSKEIGTVCAVEREKQRVSAGVCIFLRVSVCLCGCLFMRVLIRWGVMIESSFV